MEKIILKNIKKNRNVLFYFIILILFYYYLNYLKNEKKEIRAT